MKKKILFAILIACFATGLAKNNVFAIDQNDVEIAISPVNSEIKLTQGQTYQGKVTVANIGKEIAEKEGMDVDAMVIAGADFLTSLLSGLVLFTTLFGVYGSNALDMMQSTGSIGTAFYMYPMAIVNLSGSGLFNAIFAFIFFFCF